MKKAVKEWLKIFPILHAFFIIQKTSELQNEKTGNTLISENVSGDVPRIGLEPTHLTAPDPKSGVSTNFTTWADGIGYSSSHFE